MSCKLVSSGFVLFHVLLVGAWCADFEVTTTQTSGVGSFRQAIEDANDNPGADRIVFNLPGDGVQRIQPLTPLPAITDPLVVDGYTQPGTSVNTLSNGQNAILLIQLDGILAGGLALTLDGGFSTVRGLVINRFNSGIRIRSSSNVVAGNFIGPDPTGRIALGNAFDGIILSGVCCNTIGGLDPADRNVIAGNGVRAFSISELGFPPATDTVIIGNFIGTDVTGVTRMAGSGSAFSVRSAVNLTVGGLEPGARNVIAIGTLGLHLYTSTVNTLVLGNHFGVGVDGISSLAVTNPGTAIMAESDARIESNRIAFNGRGVIVNGTGVVVSRNQIYSNSIRGIDLGNAALTNDVGDVDLGPNELQNFPLLTSVVVDSNLVVHGSMGSKPDTTYQLEFYANSTVDSNGFGQGEVYLGSTEITTPASGVVPFDVQFPFLPASPSWITATARDPEGNTSTFSPAFQVRSTTFLQIHAQPASVLVSPGATVTFRVDASGALPLLYQWRREGLDLPGATNALLTVSNVQVAQAGFYAVRVTNPLGTVDSPAAQLALTILPAFVQSPISQTIAPGEFVTLSAVVTNAATSPFGFRWRSNATFITSSVSTQCTTFLTVRPAQATTSFSVLVTNAAFRPGLVSASAVITVASDRDHDGLPDDYETRAALNPDDALDADADADGDGVTNRQEYLAGTDPQDGNNDLKFQRISTGPNGAVLEFAAASNKTYSVQYQEAPGVAGWQTLTNLPARRTNSVAVVADQAGASQRFYRVATPQRP